MQVTGQKAWLLNHIPVGIDVSAIIFGETLACFTKKFPLMIEKWNSSFLSVAATSASVINAEIVGHTHANEFRIIEGSGGASIPVLSIPSISPVHGNNPAFQIMSVNAQDTAIEDVATYSVDLSDSAGNPPQWRKTSDFQKDYGQTAVNGASLRQARGELQNNPEQLNAYILRMNSGAQAPSKLMQKNANAYACGISNLDPTSFQNCYCRGQN
jgi:sphingomyelin phosphodiesterase acid-like 3